MKKFIRKITKKGKYSYSITIPKQIMAVFNWRDRQKLNIKIYGQNKLLISDWPGKK